MSGLSGDQIIFYREQGYLTVPDALDLGTVERLSAIVAQWTIEASGVSESDGFLISKTATRRAIRACGASSGRCGTIPNSTL